MNREQKKTCPKCRQKDATEFSTCRFCATRYDAKVGKGINEKFVVSVGAIIFLIWGIWNFGGFVKAIHTQKYGWVSDTIIAANKPRVIEFYAPWCPSCQAYLPVLVQCENKYLNQIDFQRLNTDDPTSREMSKMFQINSIPHTFLFNRKGDCVADFVGMRSYSELDKYLRDQDFIK